MLRRVVITASLAALALALGVSAAHPQSRTLLMPGVSYEREVEFTPHGPVVMHVLRAPRPTGLYALRPVLSNGLILGRERVTQMQRRMSTHATVAGINGDATTSDGRPNGLMLADAVLSSAPNPDRSSVGLSDDGSLIVDRVRLAGRWQGTGQRRALVLNRDPSANGVALYTPAYGPTTPARAEGVEVVVRPFPATRAGVELSGVVVEAKQGGGTPIPPDGAVLAGRGEGGAGRLATEAPLGTTVRVRLTLTPDWSPLSHGLGGGPVLVGEGRPVARAREVFAVSHVAARQPRSAVGQTADGSVIFVTVDGARPGYSVGMTNFELAVAMARLGARTASALDGGGAATMAFDGRLLNRPSDRGGERAIADSLNVFYYGVFAPEPAEAVVSPNGDGVAEQQTLAYKLVRPSHVVARVIAPDGSQQLLENGFKSGIGTYRYPWRETGPEGTWRLVVDVTDDLGRESSAQRTFSLNTTLGALRVQTPTVRPAATLRASYTLARPAQVRVTVTTATGAALVALPARSETPGSQALTWRVRGIRGGRYQLRVTAQNQVGTSTLIAPFAVRGRR